MKRRTAVALILLGVVLSVATPALANFLSGGKDVGKDVSFDQANGPNVTVGESFNFTNSNPWVTSNRLYFEPYGNFTSNGDTHARWTTINGTWTNLTQLEVASADLTVNINDKQQVTVGGDASHLQFTDMAIDDGQVDFAYGGASGTTTLTIQGLPASTQIAAIDTSASPHTVLDVDTTDASGTLTLTLPNSDHTVELQTTDGGPTIDDSSLSPNTTSTSVDDADTITLSADVSDPDLPDDEVNVSFYVEGTYVGSDVLQDSGTASVTISRSKADVYDWHAEAEDAYGQTDSSNTAQFLLPNTLYIYNETAPSTLIKQQGTFTVRFFDPNSPTVVERTTSDGTLNLTGLPADDRLVVTVDGEQGNYSYRRIVLTSLIDQNDVYLLPSSQPSVDVELSFTDYTGRYPTGSTYLFIEAPIRKDHDGDGNNETIYKTISGDTIGPTASYPATLAKDERYRLRIKNGPNARVLGGYTATKSEVTEITIRGLTLEPPEGQTYATKRIIDRGSSGQREFTWKYRDESRATTKLTVRLTYRENDTVVYSDTVTNSTGLAEYAVYDIPLKNHTAYQWNWTATRNGSTIGATLPVGRGGAGFEIPLDPAWLWPSSLVVVVFVASLAGARKHTYLAITAVAFAGVLMFLGTIEIAVPLWWLAAVIAVGGHLKHTQSTGV